MNDMHNKKINGSKKTVNLRETVSSGGVVVDGCVDESGKCMQISSVIRVDVFVVDVNERVAICALVFRRHSQRFR